GGNKFELPEHMADIAESVNTKRSDMGLGWEQTFSLTSILKFNASLSYTKRKSYYGAQQDPNAYGETSNPVFSGNIVYNNFSVKNHSFVGGVSYKSDSLNDKAPAYNRVIDVVYSDLGIFIQDEIDFFKGSTSLLVGVRGDKHSEISSMILSPRASLLYKGFNDLTLRATFSTGFRAPQVFDEDLHITMVGGDARLIRNR
ncbi:MAG: TonB-dependent receptor, partial [bacterium]|nr:TonB-dependent receptor [bacterium]